MKPESLRDSHFFRPMGFIVGAFICLLLIQRIPDQIGNILLNSGFVSLNNGLSQKGVAPAAVPQFSTAQSSFSQAVFWLKKKSAGWRGLGLAAHAMHDNPEAIKAWIHVDSMPTELLLWGHVARMSGDDATALRWYELSRQLDPKFVDASYYIGLTHFLAGDVGRAREMFEDGLQRTRYESIQMGDLLYRLGQSYASLPDSDPEHALSHFNQALSVNEFEDPYMQVRTVFARGNALQQLSLLDEAKDSYQEVLDLDPAHYWAHVRLAMLIWRLYGDGLETERLLRMAIELEPTIKWAYANLGNVYEAEGRLEEAEDMYRQALLVDPNDEEIVKHLTNILNNGEK